jgi:hypothetical protein
MHDWGIEHRQSLAWDVLRYMHEVFCRGPRTVNRDHKLPSGKSLGDTILEALESEDKYD